MKITRKSTSALTLEQALELHQAGRLDEAIAAYHTLLGETPEHPDALNLLGTALLQTKKAEEALPYLEKAVSIAPLPLFCNNLGQCYRSLEAWAEASGAFQHVVANDPALQDAHLYLAEALAKQEDYPPALDAVRSLLALSPHSPEALLLGAQVAIEAEDTSLALDWLERYRAIAPPIPEWENARGEAVHAMGQVDEAIRHFRQALKLNPGYGKAHENLGEVLYRYQRFNEPDYAQSQCNWGTSLLHANRFSESIAALQRALDRIPKLYEAHFNMGVAYQRLGDFKRAEKCYRKSLDIAPRYPEAMTGLAHLHLMRGELKTGWEAFEYRFAKASNARMVRPFKQPLWNGQPLGADQTLYLHAEQGFGDSIQFIRFIAQVRSRIAARILVEIPKPLYELFKDFPGVDAWVVQGEIIPSFTHHLPFMSQPRVLGVDTVAQIPAPVPYLFGDRARYPLPQVDALDSREGENDGSREMTPKVGLVWAARPFHEVATVRSLALDLLTPLFDLEDVAFYGLQKGPAATQQWRFPHRDRLPNLGPTFRDFADTASAIAQLDLVITVDTSVAHLAGAMGKPVWVLLPWVADWRWLRDRIDSPWYPTARLWRQPKQDDWESVISSVKEALQRRDYMTH